MHSLLAFLLAAALFSALEHFAAADRQRRWWRRPLRVDVMYWFLNPFFDAIVLVLVLLLVGLVLMAALGPALDRPFVERLAQGRAPVADWPPLLQAVAAFVLADFTLYWIHRAFHRIPCLWPLHAIHHSATEVDWLAAVRNHPLGSAIATLGMGSVLLLAGFPLQVLGGVVPLLGLLALLGHANVAWTFGRLGRWIASPVYHRWHHTRVQEGGDRNFASFLSVWDRWFGTWYLPADRLPQRFGIDGDPVAHGLVAQLWHPLAQWLRCRGRPARTAWVAALLVAAVLGVGGALAAPTATLLLRTALPRDLGDLHVAGYAAADGDAPLPDGERLHVALPRDEAHRWFMAAAGKGLPPHAATPGARLFGALRCADGGTLPMHVVSDGGRSAPAITLTVTTARMNAWLARQAPATDDAWVLQLEPGSSLTPASEPPPADWHTTLVLDLRGRLCQRAGAEGPLQLERLRACVDVRFTPLGDTATAVTFRLRVREGRVRDATSRRPVLLPQLFWQLGVAAINRDLAKQPTRLELALPPTTTLAIALLDG